MEIKDMRSLNYTDLLEKLKEAQKKLFELKMQLANQQLKNYMEIAELRREIARMHTVLSAKRAEGEHTLAKPQVESKPEKDKKEVKKEKREKKEVKKEVKKVRAAKPKKEKVKVKE